MISGRTNVLLIEDNPGDAYLIEAMLQAAGTAHVKIETATRLATGLARLAQGGIDVVLLDLALPDSKGLRTLELTHACAPHVPIIVLTGHEDEALGANVVWAGAQDYLVKGKTDGALLWRSLRYAVGRQIFQAEAHHQSFIDQVTGLYNLRGFLTLASRELKLAQRRMDGIALILTCPLGFKEILLAYGPQQAYNVLSETARVLRNTYRETDILARTGTGELAVLAVGTPAEHARKLVTRFLREAKEGEATDVHPHRLLLHTGMSLWDPAKPVSVHDLLGQARAALAPAFIPPGSRGRRPNQLEAHS